MTVMSARVKICRMSFAQSPCLRMLYMCAVSPRSPQDGGRGEFRVKRRSLVGCPGIARSVACFPRLKHKLPATTDDQDTKDAESTVLATLGKGSRKGTEWLAQVQVQVRFPSIKASTPHAFAAGGGGWGDAMEME